MPEADMDEHAVPKEITSAPRSVSATDRYGLLRDAAGPARYELVRSVPSEDLSDLVDCHWVVRWQLEPDEVLSQEILPHPCVNVAGERGSVTAFGIARYRATHVIEKCGTTVGTKFRPGAFASLTGCPASALGSAPVALEDSLGRSGRRAALALRALTEEPRSYADAFEGLIRELRIDGDDGFGVVSAAVDDMLRVHPATTVAEIAERRCVSIRSLQRLFRHYVGVSPKWVLKRFRVHVVAERLASDALVDLPALSLELGYSDQSHMTRDFTAQVGRSPAAYARDCRRLGPRPDAFVQDRRVRAAYRRRHATADARSPTRTC